MTPRIRAHPIDDPSMANRVRHYDELPENAKERLPSLLNGGSPVVPTELAASFQHGEVVKFTEYYRIEILEDGVAVRAETRT